MTLFVFDFDGVLFDSARECLEVAYRTVRADVARWTFAAAWPERPTAALASEFARYRYHVGPPWQFAVLLECLARGEVPAAPEAFRALAQARRPAVESFTEAYFAERTVLAQEPRWLDLITPHVVALDLFRARLARGCAAILSTRDDRSIAAICAHHGAALSPASHLPRSAQQEKWEILLETARDRALAPADLFFVDDYVQHALPARQHGIAAHLALWGYLAPDDEARSLTAGLPCLQLSDLERALHAHEEPRT